MKESVGIRAYTVLFTPELLKRDFLMFNKIGIMGSESFLSWQEKCPPDLPWLYEQGFIFDPQKVITEYEPPASIVTQPFDDIAEIFSMFNEEFLQFASDKVSFRNYLNEFYENNGKAELQGPGNKPFAVFLNSLFSTEILLRTYCDIYRSISQVEACPIILGKLPEISDSTATKADVITITINHLPVPDELVSWEQIADFRNDSDTEGKFLGIRNWMNDIARAKLTPIEIEQKLEWLLHEYQEHMKLHKMKANSGALETVLVTTGEAVENIVKLNFSKLAKLPFSIRQRKLALLEGELKAPGREVAFISKAQETFR